MPVPASLVRFGVFELDPEANELRKNGRKVKLQDQPFRLLNLLIENPGQPASRDRMKEVLWTADTFVDFNHSLNAAIAKLRQALGDPAENPRFIETVARKGYRFIAPVEFVSTASGSPVVEVHGQPDSETPVGLNGRGTVTQPSRMTKDIWLLLGASVLLTLAGAAFWMLRTGKSGETTLVRLTNDGGLNTNPAISPDGKLLAYASDRGSSGNTNIWIQQLVPGGSAVQLTHDEVDANQPAFSPDGANIVFHSNKDGGGIYRLPVIGGQASRLVAGARDPRYSPDGRWIAYSSSSVAGRGVLSGRGSEGVFVLPAAGGEPRRLGGDLSIPAHPVWSPDSSELLVYVPPKLGYQWDEADWWLVPIDGTRSRRTNNFAELKRQGFSLGFDRVPKVAAWSGDSVTFAAGLGDSVNVWRAPISSDGHISGRASRLTSGTTMEVEPVAGPTGSLIFASLNRSFAIWSIPTDSDLAHVTGEITKVTSGTSELTPSVSADGEKIAFISGRSRGNLGAPNSVVPEAVDLRTHIIDTQTGRETVFADAGTPQWHPQISRDGSMVSYTLGKPGKLFAAHTSGGSPWVLLDDKHYFPWDWSLDNKQLLFNGGKSLLEQQVHILDISSGRERLLISKPGSVLFQAKFSPDDRAIAFLGCGIQCEIFVVPFQDGVTPTPDRWIAINHAGQWDDKPRWSPDGKLLYFVSDRDGYLCLWAQRLDGKTKRPIGVPFGVYHFHKARLAMSNLDTGFLEFDVARNKIVLGLGELTGDIWSARKTR